MGDDERITAASGPGGALPDGAAPDPAVVAARRRDYLDSIGRFIEALHGMAIVAGGYADQLCELEEMALGGAGVDEILHHTNLTGYRLMLATSMDETETARDQTRIDLLRLGLAEGLGLDDIALALSVPLQFLEGILGSHR